MSFWYLAALIFSLLGLVTLDAKHKLAFFSQPFRSALTFLVPYLFFIVWDIAGIQNGIFFRGDTKGLTGITVVHEFPLEELFFLALLCYTALLAFRFFERKSK